MAEFTSMKDIMEITGAGVSRPVQDLTEITALKGLVYHHDYPDSAKNPCCVLAVDQQTQRIVGDSNGYFPWWLSGMLKEHVVNSSLDGLGRQFGKAFRIMTNRATPRVRIAEPCFYLTNAYTGWNFGHDLSTMLFALDAYGGLVSSGAFRQPPALVVSPDRLAMSPNTRALLQLLAPDARLIEAPYGTLVECDQLLVPANCYFHLQKPEGFALMRALLRTLRKRVDPGPRPSGTNVILSKLETHKFARRGGILPKWVIDRLTAAGWTLLDPEKMTYFELAMALDQAERVVMGSGAVQYAHRNLVNPDAEVFILFDQHNYDSPLMNFGLTRFLGIAETDDGTSPLWEELLEKLEA